MSEKNERSDSKAILVIGGGISGITVAVEAAELGRTVYLVEKTPSLGGRVARMNKYFPKLCPPSCGLEINYQRLRKSRDKIEVLTQTEVTGISGEAGAFEVSLKIQPRCVNEKCTTCDECVKVCPVERTNDFNYGLDKNKAIYRPFDMCWPERYVIDMDVCKGKECAKCVEVCKYDAIDLEMKGEEKTVKVGAIVVATGWDPYEAAKIENLKFASCENVITNVMMERLAAPNGPTQGKIVRPSDGKPVKNAVFVQCAGSRDVEHLPYCSGICCLASLKQAKYLRESDPEARAHVFYIDLRAIGAYEDFLVKAQEDGGIIVKKGKVAKIEEDPATKDLQIEVEDILGGGKLRMKADLVVLATGMVSSLKANPVPARLKFDDYGFCAPDGQPKGLIAAGTAKGPMDVASAIQDATGAVLEAIHATRGLS